MSNLFPYLLKFSIVFAILLAFFSLVLRKETLHYFKRLVLLSIPVVAVFIPLISFEVKEETMVYNIADNIPTIPLEVATITEQTQSLSWQEIAYIIIALVAFVLFVFTLIGVAKVFAIIKKSKKEKLPVGVLCNSEKPVSPFSFFDFIVVHRQQHNNDALQQIIEHEQVHVYQKHFIDMLIAQLLCVFCWWNPLVWVYRHYVIENLEFIVDQEVIRSGVNKKHYQLSILSTSVYDSSMVFANHFNHSLIKKRIKMMNQKLSNPKNMWKTVLVLPILFILWVSIGQAKNINASMEEITNESILPESNELLRIEEYPKVFENEFIKIVISKTEYDEYDLYEVNYSDRKGSLYAKKQSKNDVDIIFKHDENELPIDKFLKLKEKEIKGIGTNLELDDKIEIYSFSSFSDYESEMVGAISNNSDYPNFADLSNSEPTYPGGMDSLRAEVSRNFKLPTNYKENGGLGGTIETKFAVSPKGDIANVKIIKGLSDCNECNENAKSAILNLSKKFTPAIQEGKALYSWLSLPIIVQPKINSNVVLPQGGGNSYSDFSFLKVSKKDTVPTNNKIYDFAEIQPEYPGGVNALRAEVQNAFEIPKGLNSGGTMVVRFIVLEDGSIGQVKVIKELKDCDECSENAMSAIKAISKKFVPAKQDDNAVKVWYALPIVIQLAGKDLEKYEPETKQILVKKAENGQPAEYKTVRADGSPVPPPPPPPPSRENQSGEKVYDFAEQQPLYPGGVNALRSEVQAAYDIPQSFLKSGSKGGQLVTRFIVMDDGSVGTIKVVKAIQDCDECSENAIVAIKAISKKFVPAKQDEKAVKVWYTLPIVIQIGEEKKMEEIVVQGFPSKLSNQNEPIEVIGFPSNQSEKPIIKDVSKSKKPVIKTGVETAGAFIEERSNSLITENDRDSEYPGGHAVLGTTVQKNYIIPETFKTVGAFKMVSKFIVLEDGSVGKVIIEDDIKNCDGCADALKKALTELPEKFTPAKVNNKIVKQWYKLPLFIEIK